MHFQDSFKNIWTGVWGGGINFLSYEPPLFSGYYYSPNQNSMSRLNNKTASSICVDSQGKLWIGTDGGGINVFDKGKRVAVYLEDTEDMGEIPYWLHCVTRKIICGLACYGWCELLRCKKKDVLSEFPQRNRI